MQTLTVGGFPTELVPSRRNRQRVGRAEAKLNETHKALTRALGADPQHFSAAQIRRLGHGELLENYVAAGRAWRRLQQS